MALPLNSLQLYKILKTDKCTRYKFIGVYARDKLPQKLKYPSCFIINTKNSKHPGEHWLAFYYNSKKHCFFFDSFGMDPKFYKLDKYLKLTSLSYSWNHIQYQNILSQTCGYYCFLFLLFKCRNIDLMKKDINDLNLNKYFK